MRHIKVLSVTSTSRDLQRINRKSWIGKVFKPKGSNFLLQTTTQQDHTMFNNTPPVVYNASWSGESIDIMLTHTALNRNTSTFAREFHFACNRFELEEFLYDLVENNSDIRVHAHPGETATGAVVSLAHSSYANYTMKNRVVQVSAYGSRAGIEYICAVFEAKLKRVHGFVHWMYSGDGDESKFPVRADRVPKSSFYPFLEQRNCSITEYYRRFMKSDSNILLLIGPPGTGKTSFITGMIAHLGINASLAFGKDIVTRDQFYARFMSNSNSNLMIVEDADVMLSDRKEGNEVMHNFLNLGDGVISSRDKKIVFSTNLPSINSIDPALLRPGRCFDILNFNKLDSTQARAIIRDMGISEPVGGFADNREYTLAEVFNGPQDLVASSEVHRPFGFTGR